MVESHLRTTFCKTRGRSLSGVGVPDELGIGESMAVDQAAGTLPSLTQILAAESINGTKYFGKPSRISAGNPSCPGEAPLRSLSRAVRTSSADSGFSSSCEVDGVGGCGKDLVMYSLQLVADFVPPTIVDWKCLIRCAVI